LLSACLLPFNLFGFPFAAWTYEHTGSYASAFLTFVALYAFAALALTRVKLTASGASLQPSPSATAS
jgi:hypothetical protein